MPALLVQIAQVIDQFGVDVKKLEDLVVEDQPNQRSGESGEPKLDVQALIHKIEATRLPMKRNMTLWPRGAMNKFQCTVCVVPVGTRAGSLLGI